MIIEVNKIVLENLKLQYEEQFADFHIQRSSLVFHEESVNLEHFNLYDLLSEQPLFSNSISSFSSEDIFRIIKLHANRISSEEEERFYTILKKDTVTEEEKKFMNYCLTSLKEFMQYEDFLLLLEQEQLQRFTSYILLLEVEEKEKTQAEQEAIKTYQNIVSSLSLQEQKKEKEDGASLKLELDKAGSVSTIEIIAIALGFTTFFICSFLCLFH